jgi:hypothetical protein
MRKSVLEEHKYHEVELLLSSFFEKYTGEKISFV